MVALLLWFYLGTRGVPQNVVEASANSLWQGGRRRVHSNSLHLGREVPVYAFCGTSAAKVNLINCKNVFPSGEKGFWPEEKHLNDVSSTERRVWPDGNDVGVYRSQQWSASDGPVFLSKRALPPFPASCYAELVTGGHLPTIAGAHISAPAGPCILRQQNMERQVGRQG